MSIIIGNNQFKYKKDALAYYRNILNSYDFGNKLTPKDKNEIIELLKKHPNGIAKIEKGIKNILVDRAKYNAKAFVIEYAKLEKEIFSYIKCLNGEKPLLTIFSNTCRDVVSKDIYSVKYKYFSDNSKEGKVKCQETGILCEWKELVVDHRQPNTFSVIVDRFMEVNNIDISKVEFVEVIDGAYEFKDKELAVKFREYHKEKANLRIVKTVKNSNRSHQARVKRQKKDLKIE